MIKSIFVVLTHMQFGRTGHAKGNAKSEELVERDIHSTTHYFTLVTREYFNGDSPSDRE